MQDTPETLDARAGQMRKENADAFDSLFDGLRRAGLLIEFSQEAWDRYNEKHFGPGADLSAAFEPAGRSELGYVDRHRLDPYDPEPQ